MFKIRWVLPISILIACFQWVSCGSAATTTAATATTPLIGQWVGQNSTNKCLATTDPCASTKFTVTFTADKTYSIVSDDGGVATGSYSNTVTTLSTTVAPITDLTGSGCTISFTGVNGGITAPTVSAGGAGYSVGQVLAVTDGGTGGQVAVASVSAGAVQTVTLISGGSGYATGAVTGKGTTLVGLKISACFTKDFLNGVTYTISADGKTLTIPVCPITFTKQ